MAIQEKRCKGVSFELQQTYLFNLLTSAPLMIIDLITYDTNKPALDMFIWKNIQLKKVVTS